MPGCMVPMPEMESPALAAVTAAVLQCRNALCLSTRVDCRMQASSRLFLRLTAACRSHIERPCANMQWPILIFGWCSPMLHRSWAADCAVDR